MMMAHLEKSAASERKRVEELIEREAGAIRRSFGNFLRAVTSAAALRQLRRALETQGVDAALEIVDAYFEKHTAHTIVNIFARAGAAEADALASQLPRTATVRIGFDPTDRVAAELARQSRLEFIRGFSRSQREAVRVALTEGLETGAGARAIAGRFRGSIGLTASQEQAVRRYRGLLEAGDKAALDRGLRDRRFDSSVRRAADTMEPLGAARINRMVDRYRENYLRYRAEVISRTESHRVVNIARDESLRQVQTKLGIPSSDVQRTWRATADERTRDTHREMNGQVRAVDVPFDSPRGARLMFPSDSSLGAPASEVVQCRCVLTVAILPST